MLLCFQRTFPVCLTSLGLIGAPQSVSPPRFIGSAAAALMSAAGPARSGNSIASVRPIEHQKRAAVERCPFEFQNSSGSLVGLLNFPQSINQFRTGMPVSISVTT